MTDESLKEQYLKYAYALGWTEETAPTSFDEYKALVEKGRFQRMAVHRMELIQQVIDRADWFVSDWGDEVYLSAAHRYDLIKAIMRGEKDEAE